MAKEGEILKRKIKKEYTNLRFNILIIIIYVIGIILISKLFELQIVKGAEYRETSNTRLSRESVLEASRGEILDRSGSTLATSTSSFNLELYKIKSDDQNLNNCILNLIQLFENYGVKYPDNFPMNKDCTSFTIEGETLTKWLNKYKLNEGTTPEETIKYFIKKYGIKAENSSTRSLKLAENVSREVVAKISERNSDFPGVTITTQSARKYNYNNLASHIIGYIGKISEKEYNEAKEIYNNDDYVGRTGIESLFEDYLRGEKRKRRNRNVS